jgi:hypothetical protein
MSDTFARCEFLLSLMNISEKLEFLDEFLVCIHIHQNGCTPAVLGEKYRAPAPLNLPHDTSDIGAELGE